MYKRNINNKEGSVADMIFYSQAVARKTRGAFLFMGFCLLLCTPALATGVAHASQDGLCEQDPMVKICSLPIKQDIAETLSRISKDVSAATGIEQKYVTYYWLTLDAINCMGKKTVGYPILVDLYVPGFFTDKQVATMMTSIADALEKNVGIDKKWVFIQAHFPGQGHVYLGGKVQYWENYRGGKEN